VQSQHRRRWQTWWWSEQDSNSLPDVLSVLRTDGKTGEIPSGVKKGCKSRHRHRSALCISDFVTREIAFLADGIVLRFQKKRRSLKSAKTQTTYSVLAWVAVLAASGGLYTYQVSTRSGPTSTDTLSARFTFCSQDIRINCIGDGDTFWYERTKIRIADIDAPEVSAPLCSADLDLGNKATRRLLEWMNTGPFTLTETDRDHDRYGRKLRIVSRDGKPVGDALVSEGLAHRWEGEEPSWCG
jgi:micrococcal nuclease